MRFLSLAGIILVILLLAESAEACSCGSTMSGDPPCQSFWNSPVVFSGRVTEIKDLEIKAGEGYYIKRRVSFAVSAVHRGAVGGVVDVMTGHSSADCGYKFEPNEIYLVYAHNREGNLWTGMCEPTKRLSEAAEDLEYIQGLASAKPVGSLFGGIWEYKRRKFGDERPSYTGMAGMALAVEGKSGRYSVVTDKDGKYRIPDLIPGEYLLRPTVPNGYLPTSETKKVTMREKGCSVMDFVLWRETSVSGRILDAAGVPVTKLSVELVPIEEIDEPFQNNRQSAYLDDEGRFSFRALPPGTYYLGVGLGRGQAVKHAFPKTYYPGTQNRGAAAVVVVEEGQIQKDFDFQLPPPLPERKVAGIVVFPDGKPAAKASLSAIEGAYNGAGGAVSGEDGRFELSLLEGLTYRVRAFVSLPSGEQRHAELVSVPSKGKVTNLRVVLSEAGGSCARCHPK